MLKILPAGIDYTDLQYGSQMAFATVGSNNGHDGNDGAPFANNTEILADFTARSIHVENVVGKAIIEAFYGSAANRSYYLGCSTGGRQGMYAAFHFPDDFDGIIAGSPAVNFNGLLGASGMWTAFFGATTDNATFMTEEQWILVENETMRQCDGIDGVFDQVITEPDACDFRPEEIQCSDPSMSTDTCLSKGQVESLKLLYGPLYGLRGQFLFPPYNLGADGAAESEAIFNGAFLPYTEVRWGLSAFSPLLTL